MEMQCYNLKCAVCNQGGEVSVEFIELCLSLMGQWHCRLEDRRGACLSMQRQRWWRGIGGWMDES